MARTGPSPLDPPDTGCETCPPTECQGDTARPVSYGCAGGGWVVNGSVLPEDVLRDAPSYTPRPYELADLELLLSGAYRPLTGFLGRADLTSLRRRGRLADGIP